jgi:hypothetical protein
MKGFFLIALFFLLAGKLSAQSPQQELITFKGIGSINVCQKVSKVRLKYLRDSTFNGDGFEYYGKYYRDTKKGIIRASLSLYDSLTIGSAHTASKAYHTVEGIRVGTTLEELANKLPHCQIMTIYSEYEDLYCYIQTADRRIEFRVNGEAEIELSNLKINDTDSSISKIEGLTELAKRMGKAAYIKEISVVATECRE